VELGDGQVLERIDFSLPPGAVIAGQVLDDAGDPLAGAVVQALRQQYVQGVRQLGAAAQADVTDDLGQFRVFGLPPGTYFLRATVPSVPLPPSGIPVTAALGTGGAATYYPGTLAAAEALPVRVDSGVEISGLSFAVAVQTKTATISGVVLMSDGSIPAGFVLSWAQPEGGVGTLIVSPRDGTFSIPNLPPGRYTLVARQSGTRPAAPAETQIAVTEVALADADVAVAMTLGSGAVARGRITLDAAGAVGTLTPSSVRLVAEATDAALRAGLSSPQSARDDWTFEIAGLAGTQRLRVLMPPAWMVGSIRHFGRNVTDRTLDFSGEDVEGIEIQLTQRIGMINGLLRDARGQAVGDATVVLFADDRDRWDPGSRYLRAARPDQGGRFTIDRLPEGRYMAVALDFLESGEETNPETLERLRPLATGVALNEGESRTLDLRVLAAP
jgi:hypothetical protein